MDLARWDGSQSILAYRLCEALLCANCGPMERIISIPGLSNRGRAVPSAYRPIDFYYHIVLPQIGHYIFLLQRQTAVYLSCGPCKVNAGVLPRPARLPAKALLCVHFRDRNALFPSQAKHVRAVPSAYLPIDFDHYIVWLQRGLLANCGLPFLWTLQRCLPEMRVIQR